MKIKLIIALVVLALVFGMSFIACDDGELQVIKVGEKETIVDLQYVPYLDKDNKEQGVSGDTTGLTAPEKPGSEEPGEEGGE